jgi:two-component system nitrogen regulation response regulator NtrX
MAAKRILVVDDEPNVGASLRMVLEGAGYNVLLYRTAAEFQAKMQAIRADAYLLDVRLPDGNGIELLRTLRQNDHQSPVVMISGHGTIADAVTATRVGAFDFLEKPLSRDRVLLALKNALEQSALQQENARLRELIGDGPRMIGVSPAFQRILEQASQVARSDARVLLMGESGTGKELIAAHLHRTSPFASGPFIKVNCAAIPVDLLESELFGHEKGSFTGATSSRRGKFELADGGSIFLDEVGDLHETSQAKLLRVLQEGEFQRVGGGETLRVTVRVISATNRDLGVLVEQKKFRQDLYYRLSVVPIRVPPLRERIEDIRPLAEYFLEDFRLRNNFKPKRIEGEVWTLLQSYRWPGNIRELRNVIERMAILADSERITKESVPLEIRIPPGLTLSATGSARFSRKLIGTYQPLHERLESNALVCTSAFLPSGFPGVTEKGTPNRKTHEMPLYSFSCVSWSGAFSRFYPLELQWMLFRHFRLGNLPGDPGRAHRINRGIQQDEIKMPHDYRQGGKAGLVEMNCPRDIPPELREQADEIVIEPHHDPGCAHDNDTPDQGPILSFFGVAEAVEPGLDSGQTCEVAQVRPNIPCIFRLRGHITDKPPPLPGEEIKDMPDTDRDEHRAGNSMQQAPDHEKLAAHLAEGDNPPGVGELQHKAGDCEDDEARERCCVLQPGIECHPDIVLVTGRLWSNFSLAQGKAMAGPLDEVEGIVQEHAPYDHENQDDVDGADPIKNPGTGVAADDDVHRTLCEILAGTRVAPAACSSQIGFVDTRPGI